MHQDDDQAGRDVDAGHGGHELAGDVGDGADAAEEHDADERGDEDAEEQGTGGGTHQTVLAAGDADQLGVGLVDLEEVAAEQAEEQDHEGGEDREDLAELGAAAAEAVLEALGQVVHRAAGDGAVGVHLAVLHAEGDLDELGGHAEQAAQDHPERGAGAAPGDGDGHTGDVAEADRAGDGGGQGLEVVDLTGRPLLVVLPAHHVDRESELADLHEAEPAGEDQTGDDEPGDDEGKFRSADGNRVEDDFSEPLGYRFEEIADGFVDVLGDGVE